MTEEWRPIPDHPNYEVSSLGRVRSVDREVRGPYGTTRKLKGRPIKLQPRPDGYLQFQVRRGTTVYVHRAVALAFLGPAPAGLEACHNDGDPEHNAVSNLRWDTHSSNVLDKHQHGSEPRWQKTHCERDHELAGANLRAAGLKRGMRACRSCANAQLSIRRHPERTFEEEAARYYARYRRVALI